MGISKIEKWIGIVAILLIGLIHVVRAPAELGEAPYFGLMFVGNGVAAVVAAFGILRGARLWGWELGLFIAVGSLVGYVISRTVGLPGYDHGFDGGLRVRESGAAPLHQVNEVTRWLNGTETSG
jgi:hypothetical protein